MKKGFSLLELVIVIVVIAIIAIIAIPRFTRDNIQEAADQILSHIRYTQQLAMNDNKFDTSDPTWFKTRWTIEFTKNANTGKCYVRGNEENCLSYQVYTDKTKSGNLNSQNQVAKDPLNPKKYLSAGWSGISNNDIKNINESLNIQKSFGVTAVSFSKECGQNRNQGISFDELGRPMRKVSTTSGGGSINATDRFFKEDCAITLTDIGGASITIIISSETGYAYIK